MRQGIGNIRPKFPSRTRASTSIRTFCLRTWRSWKVQYVPETMERYPKSYQFDDSPHIDFSNVPFWKHNFSVLFMHYYCILMPWSTAHPLRSTQKPLDAMANATETRLRQQDLCDLLRRSAFLDLGKVMVSEWSFWIILRYLPRKSDTIIWDANFWVTVPKWPVPRYAMFLFSSCVFVWIQRNST